MLRCWLECLDGSRLRVGEGGLLLGRGSECAFRTLDTRVSARHAEVNLRTQGLFLTPRGLIPTVLNGRPIHNPRQLTDGDWISLAPGVLFRVCIESGAAPLWRISDGTTTHTLTQGSPTLSFAAGVLTVVASGSLEVTVQEPLTLNGVSLQPDRRPWMLESGDVLRAEAVTLTVTDGPEPVNTPPISWTTDEALRYHPPLSAELSAPGRLLLTYPDAIIEVPLRDDALITRLIAGEDASDFDLADITQLQEDLIRGGVDGFCLISTSAGVRLQLNPEPSARAPGEQPAPFSSSAFWLSHSDGSRFWLSSGGVLLGRSPDCDIRHGQPYVHRHHALVRQRLGRVEIVPLGQNPCYIDGVAISRPTRLQEGSWLTVEPGVRIRLGRTTRARASRLSCTVRLMDTEHTIQTRCCSVGGGVQDDLHMEGWPEGALCLYLLDEAVFCEVSAPAMLGGEVIPVRRAWPLAAGQSITIAGRALTLVSHQTRTPATPRMVILQPFQSAGRLLFRFDDHSQIRVCLPQMRYQLMQLLLEAYVGSRLRGVTRTRSPDTITDLDLPRGATHSRDLQLEIGGSRRLSLSALRDLLHQVRTDLIRAGINGERMLESQDGWARLHLGESCNVTLYS